MARVIGKPRWQEMKENARLLSNSADGGAQLLVNRLMPLRGQLRLHLIGHSAGAVIHAHLALMLTHRGWVIESLSLMAPAVRVDEFNTTVLPLLSDGGIARMAQFHLSDRVEDDEGGMRAALGYKRSLLYLISNGLEDSRNVPILGLQKHFDAHAGLHALRNVTARVSPLSAATQATRHSGFDDDRSTQQSVLAHVAGRPIPV